VAAGEPEARTGAAPRSAVGPGVRATDAPSGAGHGIHGADQVDQGRDGAAPSLFAPPTVSLPKGGGAVRGIGEKFTANPVTGTGSLSVPIFTSPGRSGFGPQLSLSYDSGAGNGPFGFGWQLGLPSITRKTDKGLPRYLDAEESDTFILSGAEDLVPALVQAGDQWQRPAPEPRPVGGVEYRIQRYRPRVEGLFARIERWTQVQTGEAHWRSISKDNVTTLYGQTPESRIADPDDPTRVFSWLICASYDDKGNAIVYEYKAEDTAGVDLAQAHERNRGNGSRSANRYLKRIKYGNRASWLVQQPDPAGPDPAWPDLSGMEWCFEVVFDYGEGHSTQLPPDPQGHQRVQVVDPAPASWPARRDPFSSYRAGFEVRTYRLCRRVLMFHHFPDALGIQDCLVRSTAFSYAEDPVASFITTITQSGYVHQGGGIHLERSLPPLELEYSQVPSPEELAALPIQDVDPDSLENLPAGLDGARYQWVDLDGEGLSGVLTEQADAWFYKPNLGGGQFGPMQPVPTRPSLAALSSGRQQLLDLAGDGQLDLAQFDDPVPGFFERTRDERWEQFTPFASLPRLAWNDPNLKFVDLTGDGHADVLVTEDEVLTWYPSLAEAGFGPSAEVRTPRDEERGPRLVFADPTQSIFVADLSGDGLTDLVRIRNGEVCYWPNLGYSHFGAKVTMDNAPWFDAPDLFDPRRVRLADSDGSGTTDLLYLANGEAHLYANQAGNAWSQACVLPQVPPTDNLSSVTVVDLLGSGTACLVWSSPLPGAARRPLRYLDLMGGTKPHLLVSVSNNLGAQTHIHYAPSTTFYLADKRAGTPWATRLPFPVHVVEKVMTYDHISRNRFDTRYAYHHGYFDGEEREFRGFGMVEQWDTEEFAALAGGNVPADNITPESHVPPVHTKTWFHTGIYLGRDHVSDYFAGLLNAADKGEYFREPGLTNAEARALLLPDTLLPGGLTIEEEREACRALKGSMLRQEVYADDARQGATPEQVQRARTPYTVTEQNFTIRTVQPQGGNRHAVFFTHAREAISYHYERNPADPRIQHALTLEVDAVGNVLKQAAIGYGRRKQIGVVDDQGNMQQVPNPGLAGLDATDQAKQTTPLLTYTENRVTNAIETSDTYRTPLPCEALTFELTGYTPTGAAGRFQASDLVDPDPAAAGRLRHKFTDQVAYEAAATGNPCRRPIEWLRTLYRRDNLNGLLPLGELHSRALPGESYKLAFTPGLLTQVFQRPHTGQPAEPLLPDPAAVLGGQAGNRGGYLQSQTLKADGRFPATDADDHWWIPSGQSFFTTNPLDATELAQARQHFFLPRRYRDPFGQDAFVDFDANDLLMTETRDALGNRVTVDVNDYRVLQPRLVSDPNRNRTEVAFDTLGMVVGTAVMGKPPPAPVEGDTLSGFVADLTQAQLDAFFDTADPHATAPGLLGDATTRIIHDLDRFGRTRRANPNDPTTWQPACTATLARETHISAPLPPQGLRTQLSFSYSDGFGREIQKKIQAEPGPLDVNDPQAPTVNPRWVGSGWTIFNNKGKPVRQYEPFFSKRQRPDGTLFSDHRFEFGVTVGVSPVLFYDPAERVIAALHPNHTYEKVLFDPWQQTSYDVNDACAPRNQQTGDPGTDPDVQGYVAEYFKTQPATWQTWHAQRVGGAMGPHERDAAQRAAAHADTPTTAHFDALGRPFLTVVRNRVVCVGHDLDGTEDSVATRVELDIEGNQLAVRDERKLPVNHLPTGAIEQRIVMRYAYDLLGHRIHQASMEAGERWMLNDVAGKPIRSWTSRGHAVRTDYDRLRRPLRSFVEGGQPNDPREEVFAQPVLFERVVYGEQHPQAEARNLCGRPFLHLDSAGVVTNQGQNPATGAPEAYDFKGNLLHSTRRLARDYTKAVDWRSVDATIPDDPTAPLDLVSIEAALQPLLEEGGDSYLTSTAFDALNRPIRLTTPDGSVILPGYNEANLLERVDAHLRGAAQLTSFVSDIDYNAKGQRTLIKYAGEVGSNIEITATYDYDGETFRLTRLTTKRDTTEPTDPAHPPFPDDCPQPPDPDWPGCGLQDLHYTYDPAGNITHIRDDAQQLTFFRQQRVEPSNQYTYDAIYRLIEATGREHLGQNAAGVRLPPSPTSYNDRPRIGLPQPNDRKAMGTYQQSYVYDEVGNLQKMIHVGSDPSNPGWTRTYFCEEDSLLEPTNKSNRLTRTTVGSNTTETYSTNGDGYDAHGNMLHMPQLQVMQWNFRDQLRLTQRQKVNGNDPDGDEHQGEHTWYVYDATGQRVRKVTVLPTGQLKDERIYLGAFEIYRRQDVSDKAVVRQTLRIMDDTQRIALVETRTQGDDDSPDQLIRYQLGNHLGSASLELGQQAQVISYEEYYPYGSTSYQAVRSQTEAPKRYRYTGKERDEETGLYYHGARYYAPWLGKWISCDPFGISGGLNVYASMGHNPIRLIDNQGKAPRTPEQVLQDITNVWNERVKTEASAAELGERVVRAHATTDSLKKKNPNPDREARKYIKEGERDVKASQEQYTKELKRVDALERKLTELTKEAERLGIEEAALKAQGLEDPLSVASEDESFSRRLDKGGKKPGGGGEGGGGEGGPEGGGRPPPGETGGMGKGGRGGSQARSTSTVEPLEPHHASPAAETPPTSPPVEPGTTAARPTSKGMIGGAGGNTWAFLAQVGLMAYEKYKERQRDKEMAIHEAGMTSSPPSHGRELHFKSYYGSPGVGPAWRLTDWIAEKFWPGGARHHVAPPKYPWPK
jgi:RHS repeat-associated protein